MVTKPAAAPVSNTAALVEATGRFSAGDMISSGRVDANTVVISYFIWTKKILRATRAAAVGVRFRTRQGRCATGFQKRPYALGQLGSSTPWARDEFLLRADHVSRPGELVTNPFQKANSSWLHDYL